MNEMSQVLQIACSFDYFLIEPHFSNPCSAPSYFLRRIPFDVARDNSAACD
jgi:hypothetical protein